MHSARCMFAGAEGEERLPSPVIDSSQVPQELQDVELFVFCHPECRGAPEGPPAMRRADLLGTGLFNHDHSPKSSICKAAGGILQQVLPPPDQLRSSGVDRSSSG